MTDEELVRWLRNGQVVVVGRQLAFDDLKQMDGRQLAVSLSDLQASYDPCRATRWDLCLFCPWEACRRA